MAKGKYEQWLTEEGLLQLEAWARNGLTDEQIAANMGITRSTLNEWKKKYSDISDTLKRGKDIVDIQVENALSLSRNLLAQYMGLGSDSVDVAFSMDNQLPENPSNLFEVPENALARTSEYHLLQQNLKASRLQKDITIGKNLPTVALGGGYYYENLMDRDHTFWMGFATVSIPISGWWGGSHDIKKQKLQTSCKIKARC